MTISLQLRQATSADVAACIAIERAVFLPSEAATPEQIVTRVTQFPQGIIIAETSDKVVGFINIGKSISTHGGFDWHQMRISLTKIPS